MVALGLTLVAAAASLARWLHAVLVAMQYGNTHRRDFRGPHMRRVNIKSTDNITGMNIKSTDNITGMNIKSTDS